MCIRDSTLGNLVNRTISMSNKYFGGVVENNLICLRKPRIRAISIKSASCTKHKGFHIFINRLCDALVLHNAAKIFI